MAGRGEDPTALVVCQALLGAGGLGTATAELFDGMEALGVRTGFVGPQPPSALSRLTGGRPFRRAFGMAPHRRLSARAVRLAVPSAGWDLSYATPTSVPIGRGSGVRAIYQATRHPRVEWEALHRAERETGGRGDMTTAERRRREYEIERADLIHTTSEAVRSELFEAGVPEEKVVLSPHGVDLERFAPGEKQERLTVAFVGPLSLRKGVDMVADLAARLDREAVVETVGGPTCPWSRRIAASAPFVPRSSVPEMLASAHVLVLPSRSDGFAFVVLEALACGAVPIVTPEVGASEVVRRLDDRLVVPREAFAEAVTELMPALDLERLAREARLLAREYERAGTSRATATALAERASRLYPDRWPWRVLERPQAGD